MRSVILFFIACNFIFSGCKGTRNVKHYNYLGQASFRRSYAGHKNWSDFELDSIMRSNPIYMSPSPDSAEVVLNALIELGMADKNELFLYKIYPYLKDTIVIKSPYMDTISVQYDIKKMRAVIQIKSALTIDSISINDEPFSHTFSLVSLKDSSPAVIVFLNKYYIMNGDNYEVSIYEKK